MKRQLTGLLTIIVLIITACSPTQTSDEDTSLNILVSDAWVEPAIAANATPADDTIPDTEDDDTDVVNKDDFENANLIEMSEQDIDPDENVSAETAAQEPPETAMVINGQLATSAYMTITNDGSTDATITDMTTDAAQVVLFVELNDRAGNTTTMNRRDTLTIPAGETVTMSPDDQFIVFVGLTQALEEEQTVDAILQFESGDTQTVQFDVQNND